MENKYTFVPCHNHTEFSYLDCLSKVTEIAKRSKELGYAACATTDHGNCTSHIQFYNACKAEGIKPILGIEAYFTEDHEERKRSSFHLTLLSMNNQGLENIYKMTAWANKPVEDGGGFYYRPRISFRDLEKYGQGIICLTGCMQSIVHQSFINSTYEEGKEYAKHLLKIFGKDRLFAEIQNVNDPGEIYIPEQEIILEYSRKLAKDLGLKPVATNDGHWINKSTDEFPHEVLKAISGRNTLKTPVMNKSAGITRGRMVYNGHDYYMKSHKEMLEKFTKEEVENSGYIAEMCNVDIEFGKLHMPKFDKNLTKEQTYKLLTEECRKGYKRLGLNKKKNKQEYINRVKRELKVLKDANLQDYFLIVWDFIKYAKDNNIAVSPGRGSVSGSLIAFLLGITGVDPIKYGLIFERFYNAGRKGGMPDIDVDIAIERREQVVDYLKEKFGRDRVFSMCTISQMTTRQVLQDVGKVLGLTFEYTNELTKHIPSKHGKVYSLEDSIEENIIIKNASEGKDEDIKIWKDYIKKSESLSEKQELKSKIIERQRQLKKTFEVAKRLEGIARQRSTHACALIIGDECLFGKIPFSYESKTKKTLTGFDMRDLEKLGYLKLDVLGLKTLSVIERVRPDLIQNVHENNFDDPAVYELINSGAVKGVFQLESQLGKTWCKKLNSQSLEDLSDLCALIRPAILETQLAAKYIENKDKQHADYIHSDLEPILKNTHGIMLYQEQMIFIVQKFANFSLEDSDSVRAACGKKKPEEMKKWKDKFINGCIKNKYKKEIAEEIWEWINAASSYSFNSSHSISYSMISYLTAYIKKYHTKEFYQAMLQLSRNEQKAQEEISEIFYDAKLFDIHIKPPSIQSQNVNFEIVGEDIRYGLSHIKHIGKSSIERLNKIKVETWRDFLDNKKMVKKDIASALILSGALDCLGIKRSEMILEMELIDFLSSSKKDTEVYHNILNGTEKIVELKKEKRIHKFKKGKTFKERLTILKDFIKEKNEKLKFIMSSRAPKILSEIQRIEEALIDGNELSIVEKSGYENYYLGMPITCCETEIYTHGRKTHDVIEIRTEMDQVFIGTIGIINRISIKTDKRGREMAFLSIYDKTYSLDCILFSSQYSKYGQWLKLGKIFLFEGTKRKDSFIINKMEPL